MSASGQAMVGVLTSRVGRRLVALFAGCALLPLLGFAWLAVSAATDQMANDLRVALHNGAKTAGMGLAARLSQAAGDLALLREFLGRGTESTGPRTGAVGSLFNLDKHVVARLAAAWTTKPSDAGETVEPLIGGLFAELPPLRADEQSHLAAGKPLVRVAGEPAQLVMTLALDADDIGAGTVSACLRRSWLWDPEELRVAGSQFAAFDYHWRPLFHTFERTPSPRALMAEAARNPSSGTTEWVIADEPHLARYWRAFLRPQYHVDLFIVQSRPSREALAVREEFLWSFVMTAVCTLLAVVFVSLVQIRRTLGPIGSLRDATRRVATGDMSARVTIRGEDEFGELGAAFNDMTAQLQENIARRERTERELVRSRDAALVAVQAKAEFVTNVSHELRTPMTEILSAVEILAELPDADRDLQLEFSVIALRGARRLARLVDDVLELDATAACAQAPVTVAASLRAAIAKLPAQLGERVRLVIGDDVPDVRGDAQRLTDTWCRLLDNAGKFSADGTPITVEVSCAADRVVVAITDRGVGISPQDIERIFAPFSQVGRDQMTDKAHGVGLGLTLAKRTVERHGGTIEVDSVVGKGSTFRVLLPVGVVASPTVVATA